MKKDNKSLIIYLIVLIIILVAANIWYLVANNNKWGEILKFAENENDVPATTEVIESPRLEVFSPNDNSILDKQNPVIKFEGKMQGFFEGVMNYRIVNEDMEVVHEGYIMAMGDNYEQMADFNEEIVLTNEEVALIKNEAKIIFYEVSMKDGAEKLLLEIDIVKK